MRGRMGGGMIEDAAVLAPRTLNRVVVYTDFSYRERGASVSAQLPFVLFVNALRGGGPAGDGRRPSRLRRRALPVRAAPARSSSSAFPPTAASPTRSRWRGRRRRRCAASPPAPPTPTPSGCSARTPSSPASPRSRAARRQPVILGVRQDLPALIASRHPGRRWIQLAARLLEANSPRPLPPLRDRRRRTLAGGASTARPGACSNLPISLVSEAEIATAEAVAGRSYEGELTAVSVGRLDPEKNPLLLADVLAALRRARPALAARGLRRGNRGRRRWASDWPR